MIDMPFLPYGFFSVIERSMEGPRCKDKDFDMLIVKKTLELLKKYNIKYDPNNPVPSDDDMADAVFRAGKELYLETGTFCIDTERQIKFEEWEIDEALKAVPGEMVLGGGRDAARMIARRPDDKRRSIICGGPKGCPLSEDLYVKVINSFAQEPMVDVCVAGSLQTIAGKRIKWGTPLEIFATKREATFLREAIKRAGRPDVHLIGTGTGFSAYGEMAASAPDGMRPSDGRMISTIAELKIDYPNGLNKVAHFLEYGCPIQALATPIIGGLGGGPEGTAIVTIANLLQGVMVLQAVYNLYVAFPGLRFVANSERSAIWTNSIVTQGLSRNTHMLLMPDPSGIAGPCTDMLFYELAAPTLALITSGGNLETAAAAEDKYLDRCATGMEARLCGEVAHAAEKLSRKDANEIVKKILPKYEERQNKRTEPPGKKFPECYNLESLRPSEEYTKIYNDVKKDLKDMGVPF